VFPIGAGKKAGVACKREAGVLKLLYVVVILFVKAYNTPGNPGRFIRWKLWYNEICNGDNFGTAYYKTAQART
jgi:hypothetical protein